jgi:uncharacterized membrane protein
MILLLCLSVKVVTKNGLPIFFIFGNLILLFFFNYKLFVPIIIFLRLKVIYPSESATQAKAEDHPDELDDQDASSNRDQVDDVSLHELDQSRRTALKL